MPVVTLLEEAAFHGRPFAIGAILVHSANPIGAQTVVRSLAYWNYRVRRAAAQPVRERRSVGVPRLHRPR